MNLSGLTAVTTAAEMKAWLLANCLSPISPVMTGSDLGSIIQKVMDVMEAGSAGAAGHGLTLNGNEIDLGGTLDRQTTIDIATHMMQFLSSGGGSYSTIYQQRLQSGDLGQGITEAAISIEAAGPNGSSGIDMMSDFMNVGYSTNDGKQNMIAFSPGGLTFSANNDVRASIDSNGAFNINHLNVTGAVNLPTTSVTTGTYTIADTDYKLLIRYAGVSATHITLPDPATVPGRVLVVQNMNPDTNGTGRVGSVKFSYDIATNQGQTITANSGILLTGNMTIGLQSDGTAWTGIIDQSHSIPAGGTAAQVLSKVDGTDYNVSWTDAPASTFTNLGGAPGDNTPLAAALSAKADLVSGIVPFSQLPANVSSFIDIAYADLVTAMSAGTLKTGSYYRINDFQTVHNIPNTSPVVVNTGPVEPLITLALSPNTISESCYSQTYPTDIVYYNTSNSIITGSTKGVITRRVDTLLNVDVCNDFRNVKYRRWKLLPAAWSSTTAYTYWQTVQYTDGAIYYCSNPSGVAAGDIPSQSSDNWVMIFPNNNYYFAKSTSNFSVGELGIGSTPPAPSIPVDATNFIDVNMFQDYNSLNYLLYHDLVIKGGLGALINLVFFRNPSQTQVIKNSYLGYYATTLSSSTVVADNGNFFNMNLGLGLINSTLITTGANGIGDWYINRWLYGCIINAAASYEVQMQSLTFVLVRGTFAYVRANELKYSIMPNLVHDLYATGNIGSFKCNTSASLRSVHFLMSPGNEYNSGGDGLSDNSTGTIMVTAPLDGKTFIGAISTRDNYYQPVIMQSAIARAAYRHVIYLTTDQPSEKSTIKITNGSPLVVTWQTNLVPYLTDSSYSALQQAGAHGADTAIATYFSRHGNDFQVQQKDLISGVWTPNSSPAYTIDSVDGSGNVTQVTFHPNTAPGVTESRFIIV